MATDSTRSSVSSGLVALACALVLGGCGGSGGGGGAPTGGAGAGGTGAPTGGMGGGTGGESAAGSGGAGGTAPTGGAGGTSAMDASAGVDSAAPAGGSGGGADAASTDSAGGPIPPTNGPPPGFVLKWSATGATQGLMGFEGSETAECTHPGATHTSVVDGNIRVDMHYPADTDCTRPDRQRNEFKGMSLPGGGYVSMKQGETWLITYSMFIPDTLDATTNFTHIHQIFGTTGVTAVAGPVVTMSLHIHDGVDSIELRIDGTAGPHWNPSPLAPLQNKWVTVEFEVKWDNPGTFRWTIKDETQVYLNASRTWEGWHGGERMRPKWGIYRSRGSEGLQDTYILLNNYKVYQKE